jgi:hypothetical protein
MQSVMNSPGGGGRYTEHVWQVTLGDEALVFSNHPTLATTVHPEQNTLSLSEAHALYAQPRPAQPPPNQPWYWTYANVPPGHDGDVRPGYWQGSGTGPRSFGTDALAFLVYHIPADDPLPWGHLYLPAPAFRRGPRQRRATGFFCEKAAGMSRCGCRPAASRPSSGFWADHERKIVGADSGLLSFVGDSDRHGDFENFIQRARGLEPQWDRQTLTLSALPPEGPRPHQCLLRGRSETRRRPHRHARRALRDPLGQPAARFVRSASGDSRRFL